MAQGLIRTFPPVSDLVLHARDTPVLKVYSWERRGEFFSLYWDEAGEPPYDATEIFVRLYPFAGCAVREIHLDAGSRTHHHISHEDILFYQVSGRRVQIVNERSREVNAGDASLQIAGVWKRVDQIVAGVFVEFSLERPHKPGAEATWMSTAEAELTPVAEWRDGPRSFLVQGRAADAAPAHASRYQVRTFAMQGYALHEVSLPKGATMAPPPHPVDCIFYVVSGRMAAEIGAVATDVETADALRAPAGTAFRFEAREDAVFIYAATPPERPAWP
jgi:mannose-6-phosphate isomerase-like protein (cupin superfamily)